MHSMIVENFVMNKRAYLSGAAKKKLKQTREADSIRHVPKLTSVGFQSKGRETEDTENYGDVSELLKDNQEATSAAEFKMQETSGNARNYEFDSEDTSNDEDEQNECLQDEENEATNQFPNDASKWTKITEDLQQYRATMGPTECQNWNSSFCESAREFIEMTRTKTRFVNELFLERKLPKGEQVKREWLLYFASVAESYSNQSIFKIFWQRI